MGIIWVASVVTIILALFTGLFSRYEPMHHTNANNTIATIVADNLEVAATAGASYSVNNKLQSIQDITGLAYQYYPQNFKFALDYKMIFAQDQYQYYWLVLSFSNINFRGIREPNFGADILRALTKRVNYKDINNNNNYGKVYTGINSSCNLNSVLQENSLAIQQTFSYMCNLHPSLYGTYIVMIPINY